MQTKLITKQDIPRVLAELTLDEKMDLVGCYRSCHTRPIPEHGIPALYLMDGATGLNGTHVILDVLTDPCWAADPRTAYVTPEMLALNECDLTKAAEQYKGDPLMSALVEQASRYRPGGRQHISFPSGINIGASFDPALAEELGRAVGWELRNVGVDVCFGPNVDIARDPMGGRNYEMYGEDPELVAQTAAAFVRGMQSTGIAACAKHFLANNQETNRNTTDTLLSRRTMMELYSRGFEAAIKQGGVKTIMSAYNAINGCFTSYNKPILTDLLRGELGFTGTVVCDWGAATLNKEDALAAGLDLILPGPNDMTACKQAVLDGRLPIDVLDNRISHLLELVLEVKSEQRQIAPIYDQEALLQTACRAIAEGAVLLKNQGEVLPISAEQKVVFYGARSKEMLEYGSGSTAVVSALHSNVWEEFGKLRGATAFEEMEGADTLVYTVTAPAGENVDRDCMDIEPEDRTRLPEVLQQAKAAGLRTVVLLNICGPVEMSSWLPYADAVLAIFIPGCMGGVAAAKLLTGEMTPGGKLPVTFPLRVQDTPNYPNFPGEANRVYYGEGIFVGYRSYEKRDLQVQYPFGHGLSYTTFTLQIKEDAFTLDTRMHESFTVPVLVKNTGSLPGSQVVQVYASENKPHVLRPVKELVGYAKIDLQPGEEGVAEVTVHKKSLQCFDANLDCWVQPVGGHTLYLGTSAADIFATAPLEVQGPNPYPLNGESTIAEIMQNPQAVALVNQYSNNMFDMIGDDMLPFVLPRKLGELLSMGMIQVIPDTVKVTEILQGLYDALAKL